MLIHFVIVILYWNYICALNLLRSDPEHVEHVPEKNGATQISDDKEKQESMWPMGIVPYYFDRESYDEYIEHRLRLAMNQLEETSCVRFNKLGEIPERGGNWIHVTNRRKERECSHEMQLKESDPGVVLLELGLDCLLQRDILHSLLHAVGFKDEVTHPDRDQYIRVLWDNIHPKYRPLFRIQADELSTNRVEYDPASIMQFHDRQFSRNGRAIFASLLPGLLSHQRDNLSPLDKMKLRLMFGHECNKRKLNALLDSCRFALQNNSNTDKNVTNSNETDNNTTNSGADENNEIKTLNTKVDVDEKDEDNDKEDIPVNDDENDEGLDNDKKQNEEEVDEHLKESIQADTAEKSNEMDDSGDENLDKR